MSLINKSADWSVPNYYKTEECFPKSDGHPKAMNKLTLIIADEKWWYIRQKDKDREILIELINGLSQKLINDGSLWWWARVLQ